MALFGLDGRQAEGATAAMRCALAMLHSVDGLNERLAGELETPLEIGIGIHTGLAIVGRMGPPKTPIISAVGDSVNTAARLERTAKELSVPLVVSAETLRAAGLHTFATTTQVSLRGRAATMLVSALDEITVHRNLRCRSRRLCRYRPGGNTSHSSGRIASSAR